MDALSGIGFASLLSMLPNFRLAHMLGVVYYNRVVLDGIELPDVGNSSEARYTHALSPWKVGVLTPTFQNKTPIQTVQTHIPDTIIFMNPANFSYYSFETVNTMQKYTSFDLQSSVTVTYQNPVPGPVNVTVFLFTWD